MPAARQIDRRSFLHQGAAIGLPLAGSIASADCLAAVSAMPPSSASGPAPPARVEIVHGTPTLVIGGQPFGPMCYTPGGRDAWERPEIARRGFRVLFEMVHDIGWPGDQQQAFDHLDTVMGRVLRDAPEAYVVLRVYICNPRHFAREYPDELMAFEDGDSRAHFRKWFGQEHLPPAERGYSSFASRVWLEGIGEAVRNYIQHVRSSAYARHVIGYFLCGGGTEEWYYYENYDETRHCLDFSPAMKTALRAYLRGKYGNVARLREAWNDPAVDFDSAEPPGVRERYRATAGVFWDPRASQQVIDYFYVHNKVMEDALLYLSRVVKESTNREQIVGAFYGSLMNFWLLRGGQATFKELLRSPDIDFWSSPPQYNRRGPGDHGCIRFLNASLKKHGKLWMSESDIRTVLSKPDPSDPLRDGRSLSVANSIACLQREFAHLVCEGANGWWLQPQSNDYKDPQILDAFQQMQTIGRAAIAFDRTSDTDIAAAVSQASLFTGPPFALDTSVHLVMPSLLDAFRVQETCRIGAPVDYYELDDLLAEDTKPYKLYLMLNCFSLSGEQRQRIEALRRRGAVLVWMYAPGLFYPGRSPELALGHARELLGFELASDRGQKLEVNMKLTPEGAAYFAGFDAQRVFGSFERPRWVVDGKTGKPVPELPGRTRLRERFYGAGGGEVLARFVEGGRPSIVAKQSASGTDIWIGSVMAPADLLRTIARRAGCHLFCNADEIIYANKSFLAIHTAAAGQRTLNLRRPSDVVDVFTGRTVARNMRQFTASIGEHRTRLYYLGDAAQWAGLIG